MNKRIYFVWFFLFLFLGIVVVKLVYIQVLRHDFFIAQAKKQHNVSITIPARRGLIVDRNNRVLAFDTASFSLYAEPRKISDKDKVRIAQELAKLIPLSEDKILSLLKKDRAFVWIKRKLRLDKKEAVDRLGIKGLGWIREYSRFYPDGSLASQVIGFVDIDRKGLAGLELYYDRFLRGQDGRMWLVRDGRRIQIPLDDESYLLPRDGATLRITIDEVIQNITEDALDWMVERFHPISAWAIVMNPYTGEILAMANRPSFDLNHYSSADVDAMRNRAIADMYEPGSVFKIITASIALEDDVINEDTKIFCENGAYKVVSHILHDYHPYGELTFRQVIEKSSNIGTVKVAQMLGQEALYKGIRGFGFSQKTGIDLPGEIAGSLKPLENWSKISISAIPIGQEIGVTAIQLACAVSVIANGGYWVRPYVGDVLLDNHGVVLKTLHKARRYRVISSRTAERMREILKGVVENGTGKRARIEGYAVAGKTGTAQRIIDGRYSNIYFTSSFVGFVPADSPEVVIVVSAQTKKPLHFGGVVAAPTFRKIAVDTLNYLGIAPSASPDENKVSSRDGH